MFPPMKFDYMSWEAAATLVTGLLAVIGAATVAWRQVGIQESQHRVEKLKAKTDLFDLRYRVFVEFGVFLDTAAEGTAQLQTIIEGTRQNVDRAKFLFGTEVYDELSELFELGQKQLINRDADRSASLLSARVTPQHRLSLRPGESRWLDRSRDRRHAPLARGAASR